MRKALNTFALLFGLSILAGFLLLSCEQPAQQTPAPVSSTSQEAVDKAVAKAVGSGEAIQQQLVKESTVEQVIKRGNLRVGMSTFVPRAMKDKTGQLIGFEIDVARQLARDMGVKIEFVPTKWAGIIPALLTGKFDVIIGGMSVRPDRNLKVNFSIPYD